MTPVPSCLGRQSAPDPGLCAGHRQLATILNAMVRDTSAGRSQLRHLDTVANRSRISCRLHALVRQHLSAILMPHCDGKAPPAVRFMPPYPEVLRRIPSARYVPRLRPITYPEHFDIRLVSTNGGIRWNKRW
jgi:hypothetical protein